MYGADRASRRQAARSVGVRFTAIVYRTLEKLDPICIDEPEKLHEGLLVDLSRPCRAPVGLGLLS